VCVCAWVHARSSSGRHTDTCACARARGVVVVGGGQTHGGHGGVVSHRYSHVGEHGGRTRERHHERRSAHRRRLARVRPGGECDLGGLSRTGVFDDEWGGTRAAWIVYDSWR